MEYILVKKRIKITRHAHNLRLGFYYTLFFSFYLFSLFYSFIPFLLPRFCSLVCLFCFRVFVFIDLSYVITELLLKNNNLIGTQLALLTTHNNNSSLKHSCGLKHSSLTVRLLTKHAIN